jgi:hypothetical protein
MQRNNNKTSSTSSSNSSAKVSVFEKLIYNFTLFRMRMRGGNEGAKHASQKMNEIKHLVADFECETGHHAIDSTIVEIGFGARPERAFAFTAFFNKVIAIDLDAPVLSLRDIPRHSPCFLQKWNRAWIEKFYQAYSFR